MMLVRLDTSCMKRRRKPLAWNGKSIRGQRPLSDLVGPLHDALDLPALGLARASKKRVARLTLLLLRKQPQDVKSIEAYMERKLGLVPSSDWIFAQHHVQSAP
jgi:hypothetical protein